MYECYCYNQIIVAIGFLLYLKIGYMKLKLIVFQLDENMLQVTFLETLAMQLTHTSALKI